LIIEVDTSLPSLGVQEVVNRLVNERSKPGYHQVDKGLEFISHAISKWCEGKISYFDLCN